MYIYTYIYGCIYQDKFTLTKFSLHIKCHKELSIFVFARVYCLGVVCLQTLKYNGYHPNI